MATTATTGLQWATYGGLAAIAALMFSSGERVRAFMSSVQSLWLARAVLDEHLSCAVYSYCFKNMKPFGIRSQFLASCVLPVMNKADDQVIAFDVFKQSILCFRKGVRFAVIKPGSWLFDEAADQHFRAVELLLPRLMWRSESFIKRALDDYNDMGMAKRNRFKIVRFYGDRKSVV